MNLRNRFSTLWKRATLLLQWWKSGLGPVSGVLGFLRRGAGAATCSPHLSVCLPVHSTPHPQTGPKRSF